MIEALTNWFGANRKNAPEVGRRLAGCKWVGVPFAGGCCELPFIKCRSGLAADMHRHLINLARVVADADMKAELAERLDSVLYHPDELTGAQERLRTLADTSERSPGLFAPKIIANDKPSVGWARDYFIASWMGRGGNMGKAGELTQGISFRWNANGGDSCRRFRSAVESLNWWCASFKNWNFVVLDCFDFLKQTNDGPGHGIYCDPPWVEVGKVYIHKFTEADHRKLALGLAEFHQTKVVVRYGDHPLIRELYPDHKWEIIEQNSKDQANGDVDELLMVNRMVQKVNRIEFRYVEGT